MVTVLVDTPTETLMGRDVGSMVRMNVSSLSSILSLFIGTSNEAVVLLAENVTVYGPDV